MHRYGIGLRQELTPQISVSGRGFVMPKTHGSHARSTVTGLETVLSYTVAQNQGIGFGLHTYGAMASSHDETYWWAGAGLELSFGGVYTQDKHRRGR